jgi:hypothetical protein
LYRPFLLVIDGHPQKFSLMFLLDCDFSKVIDSFKSDSKEKFNPIFIIDHDLAIDIMFNFYEDQQISFSTDF